MNIPSIHVKFLLKLIWTLVKKSWIQTCILLGLKYRTHKLIWICCIILGARDAVDMALPHTFVRTLLFTTFHILGDKHFSPGPFTSCSVLERTWAYFKLERLSPEKALLPIQQWVWLLCLHPFCFRLSHVLVWVEHCRWNFWLKFWVPAPSLMTLQPSLFPFLSWPSDEVPVSLQQKSHCQCTCYFVIWGVSSLYHIAT